MRCRIQVALRGNSIICCKTRRKRKKILITTYPQSSPKLDSRLFKNIPTPKGYTLRNDTEGIQPCQAIDLKTAYEQTAHAMGTTMGTLLRVVRPTSAFQMRKVSPQPREAFSQLLLLTKEHFTANHSITEPLPPTVECGPDGRMPCGSRFYRVAETGVRGVHSVQSPSSRGPGHRPFKAVTGASTT